jgi:hypothetical protein
MTKLIHMFIERESGGGKKSRSQNLQHKEKSKAAGEPKLQEGG